MLDHFINGGVKSKRKDFHHFSDDFLPSPALKIRRLDVELPPIIEEQEAEVQFDHHQWMPEISGRISDRLKPLDIEELPYVRENEEKAIVVFQPVDPPIYSSGKYLVDPNLISSFKNQVLLGSHLNSFTPNDDNEAQDNTEGNTCKAVIPWVPSQQLNRRSSAEITSQPELLDAMDAEGSDTSAMEIEDAGPSSFYQQETEYINHSRLDETPHQQWQQQHCMISPPLHNIATPIVWYR